jgi:hypothetical protein
MKNILSIILLSIALVSCKPEVVKGTYTVKGYLYKDCSKTPLKNYSLLLRDNYYENGYPKFVTCATTNTDANGYFEFTYSNPASGDIYITDVSGIYPGFINALPITNLDSLEVISYITANLLPKISTINNFSKSDTLIIQGSGSNPNTKIIGPFINGQILENCRYFFSSTSYIDKYSVREFIYKIGVNGTRRTIKKNVYPCTSDTITISLN